MDLVESTIKVIEKSNAAREHFTSYMEGLQMLENDINKMKENLEQTQLLNNQSKKVLEVNNVTKNTFNEHRSIVKDLFGKVYNYTLEVEERLSTITEQESSVEGLYNENEESYKMMESKYINNLKVLELSEKESIEKVDKENSDLEKQLNDVDTEFREVNDLWQNIIDEHDEKRKSLETVRLEVEILQDNLTLAQEEEDLRLKLIQEEKESSQNRLREIGTDIDVMNDKIIELEEAIIIITTKIQDSLKSKEAILLSANNSKAVLEKISKVCADTEKLIQETQEKSSKAEEDLINDTECKSKWLREKETELVTCKNKSLEISNEIEELILKNKVLDDDLIRRKTEQEERDNVMREIAINTEKLSAENATLVTDFEKLKNIIADQENELSRKQHELQQIKSTPPTELLDIKEKIKLLDESESVKQLELETEIQEIESQNKHLQQMVEELESTINDFKLKKTSLEAEKDQNVQEMKNLDLQCDNISNEIKRLESATMAEPIKLVPKPPLKRLVPPSPKPPPKRGFMEESDSSYDGERLSYAEFMSKKKTLKGTKKPRR